MAKKENGGGDDAAKATPSKKAKGNGNGQSRRKFLKTAALLGGGAAAGYIAGHAQAAPSSELILQDDFIQMKALSADPSPVPQGGVWYRSDQSQFFVSPDAVGGIVPMVFSAGVSTGGNTLGTTTVQGGQLVFQGGANITLSELTAANSKATIIISGGAGGAGGNFSAGADSNALGTTGSVSASILFDPGAGIIMSQSKDVGNASATLTVINSWSTGTTASEVTTANAVGPNAGRFAMEGHGHRGIRDIQLSTTGPATSSYFGDFFLEPGNNISFATAGASTAGTLSFINRISSGGAIQDVTTATATGADSLNFAPDAHAHRGVRAVLITTTGPATSSYFGDYRLEAGSLIAFSTGGASTAGILSIHNLWSSATTVSSVATANAIGANASRAALEGHQHGGVPTVSVVGNTAGNTTQGNLSLILGGGPNITLSGATAAGAMTLSVSAAAGAAPTVLMADNAAAGVSASLAQTQVNASLLVSPFDAKQEVFPGNMTANTVLFDVSGSITSASAASYSASLGFYTLNNSSQLSRAFSASTSWAMAGVMNQSNSYGGYKYVSLHSSQFDVQPTFSQTHYWQAFWMRSSSAQTYTIVALQNLATAQRSGTMGAGSNTAGGWRPFMGVFSVSVTTAMPSAIAQSDINDSHAAAGFIPRVRLEATVSSF